MRFPFLFLWRKIGRQWPSNLVLKWLIIHVTNLFFRILSAVSHGFEIGDGDIKMDMFVKLIVSSFTEQNVLHTKCAFSIYIAEYKYKSTYAKVHGSVSVDALQRKEAEESACGKVHDPAFKLLKFIFRKKYYVTFWWKNTDLLCLILEMSMHSFVEIFLE